MIGPAWTKCPSKMPKHDFKKPIACWPKPLSIGKMNNFTVSLYVRRKEILYLVSIVSHEAICYTTRAYTVYCIVKDTIFFCESRGN